MKLPTYPRCSIQSRARWFGELPNHWEVKRLKFIFPRLFSGVSVNSDNAPSLDGSTAILKTSCVYGNRFNPGENKRVIETEIDRVACPATGDSLIISRMNTPELVGNCGYVDRDYENLFLPDRLWIAHFQNHPDANGKFAWYLVISHALASLTGVLATGTSDSMRNLTQEAFLDICVGVPTIPEQQQIAAFLDWKTRQIDALIALKQELLEKLKEKRLAVITQAVTRGLNPAAPLRDSGIPWLGQVPDHWQVGGFTKYVEGRADYRGKTPEKVREGVFLVTAKNIKGGAIDYNASQEFVKEEEYLAIMARGLPRLGDLLFTTEAPLGEVANIDREDIALAQRVIKFRGESRKLNNYFAKYWMMSAPFQAHLKSLATGSTALGIKASKLFALRCVVPPLEEQRSIVAFLDVKRIEFSKMEEKVNDAIARLSEYRTALITAATTGKIDVRDVKIPQSVA